jgi:5'-3' exonuclease
MVAWPMDRFEADDAMATAAHRFAPQVEQVRLLTPDKDLGQCVVGQQVVQVDRAQQKVMDEPGVFVRLGVKPAQVPDYLGLVGDSADGIPGVDGWGPKTAAAVLAAHPSLEAIPDDAAQWKAAVRGAPRLAANLKAARTQALLYRTLATVRRDVPLAEDLAALAHGGVPRAPYEAFCAQLGLKAGAGPVKCWSAP